LLRAEDVLIIQGVELNKNMPKTWTQEQLYMVLRDCTVGVGLDDEDIEKVNIKPIHFEIIVDALECFEGNAEQKKEYACNQLEGEKYVRKAIVIWISKNLLVKQ